VASALAGSTVMPQTGSLARVGCVVMSSKSF